MSTLVLKVKFIDDTQSQDIEFNSLESLSIWLSGQYESDFSWLTLHTNNSDYVFDGWNAIFQYIHENNGPVLHDLSVYGSACNCMKCNTSKSSCIALRASELNLPYVDVGASDLPRVERFGDLPDGTLFYLAQTYAYGGRQKLQKTLEDGGEHNAVYVNMAVNSQCTVIPNDRLVIRVGD